MRRTDAPSNDTLRPWQLPMGDRPVTDKVVDQWIETLEARRPESHDDASLPDVTDPVSPHGVSVVVTFHKGADLARCLESLAAQTLSRDLHEVIVVADGDTDELDLVIDSFVPRVPDLTVRVVKLSRAGIFSVRDIGIASARQAYTTFLDADDWVSPAFLETLLEHAHPHTVTLAPVVEASEGPADGPPRDGHAPPRPDTTSDERPASGGPAYDCEYDDQTVAALTRATALMVPTDLAKKVESDATPRTHQDVVFFMTLLAEHGCRIGTVEAGDEATYHRTRPPSHADRRDDFDASIVESMQVISQLDALSRACDATTLTVLWKQIDAHVDTMNAYLREHPADHDRAVDVIDGYDLEYFPYARLNAGRARALAVAYCFAPYNDSSAVVMAKRVRDRREIVDVVYNAMDKHRERDPSMRRICGPYVENEIVVDTPTYFSSWTAIESFCVAGLDKIADLERVKGPYDRIYSRVMWPASHFLAAAYKLRNPGTTWIAEFSDPAARDVAGAERSSPIAPGPFLDMLRAELARRDVPVLWSKNCLDWCEYLAYACADQIVFTNENQRDYMLDYFAVPELAEAARAKAVISPHPTLPRAFYSMVEHPYVLDPSVVNLGYFGNFYATRGLGDVVTALAALEPEVRDVLRLHVFTNNAQDLLTRVEELGIAGHVRVNGYVRFLAFLNLATKFDCLIVNDALTADSHERNPYLPSKWSDYAGAGTPVWGLVEAGSPLSARRLDFRAPVGDIDAAKEVLRQLAQRAAVR